MTHVSTHRASPEPAAPGRDLGATSTRRGDAASGSRARRAARLGPWLSDPANAAPGAAGDATQGLREALAAEAALRLAQLRGGTAEEWLRDDLAPLALHPWEVDAWRLRGLARTLTQAGLRMPRPWRAEVLRLVEVRARRDALRRRGHDELAARTREEYQRVLQWRCRQRRERQARLLAQHYHKTVRPLYHSQRGELVFSQGTMARESRSVYSKKWHNSHGPARWLDAGYWVEARDGQYVVVLYPTQGAPITLSYEAWRLRQVVEEVPT